MTGMMRSLIFLLALILLAGCTLFGGKRIQQKGFLLDAPRVARVQSAVIPYVLAQPVRLNPAFSGQLFVIQMPGPVYMRDYEQIFFVPPAKQLTEVLHRSLQHAGLAAQTAVYGMPRPGLFLKSDVSKFYTKQDTSGHQTVVLDWQTALYRVQSQHAPPCWVRNLHYTQHVPVTGQLIDAMNEAVAHVIDLLLHDLLLYAQANPFGASQTEKLCGRL